MRQLLTLTLILPAVALLSGCPIWGSGGDDVTDPPDGCFFDSECDSGRCNRDTGVCVGEDPRGPACRTNGDCQVGSYCDGDTDTCTASGTCTEDAGCAGGFWCDFRDTCVPPIGCRSNPDCAGTEVCVEGACLSPDGLCQFNYQCGPGRACLNNGCTPICNGSADCGSGSECRDGFCREDRRQCDGTAACAAGSHCVDGRCLPDCEGAASTCAGVDACAADGFCRPDFAPDPFCSDDGDCAEGHVCRLGACRTPCPGGTDDECLRFDSQLGVCNAGAGLLCYSDAEIDPECATRRDCDGADSCIDAVCR